MASYATNVINVSLIRQYKSSFTQEKSKFNNTVYKTFSSSYLKTCSDSNIKRMSSTLDSIYKKIQKGYNSIDKWWEDYNDNVEGLENSLSNGSLQGINKSSLRSFVSANLGELPDYKSNLTSSFNYNQIVNSFNSKFSNNTVGIASTFVSVNAASKSVSDKKVDSYVSKIEDFDLIDTVGAVVSTAGSRINDWAENVIEDVTDFFAETKAKVTKFTNNVKTKVDEIVEDVKQSLIDTFAYISNKVKNLWNKFVNWLTGIALPWIKDAAITVGNVLKSVGGTVGTFVISLVEGIGQFGEAIVDFLALAGTTVASVVTGLIDAGQAIYGSVTGEKWSSVTKQMWEETMGFVSNQYVMGAFDEMYANTSFGNWLATNAWAFDTVRGIGSGIGYVAGTVILTIATFGVGGVVASGGAVTASTAAAATTATQMSIVATAAGIGKGTQNAWADGATLEEGLITGTLTGLWEGIQFYLGSKIGSTNLFGSGGVFSSVGGSGIGTKVLNSLGRIVLDGADGGIEGLVQPLLNSIYKDTYIDENGNEVAFSKDEDFATIYKELFDDAGGWSNVLIQTGIGMGGSATGEVFDLGKYFKNEVSYNKNVTNIEKIDAASENIENNIKKLYNGKLSLKKITSGIIISPLNLFSRFKHTNVTDNIEISNKVLNEGIYHFTSLDNANKILDSGYVKESDYFTSYGKKKSFFFAGIPTVEDLAVNVRGLEPKRVAVKFNVDADSLVDFKFREFADKAISYEGRYNFDASKASIAYLGLFEDNGELVYRELSKADFDNYTCDISTNKMATTINKCKSAMLGMARELDYFTENLGKLKNLFSGANVKETGSMVSQNAHSILKNGTLTKLTDVQMQLCKEECSRIIENLDDYSIKIINDMQRGKATVLDPNVISIYEKITTLQRIIDGKYVPSEAELFDLIGDYRQVNITGRIDVDATERLDILATEKLDPDATEKLDPDITEKLDPSAPTDDNKKVDGINIFAITKMDDVDIRMCMDEYNKTFSNASDSVKTAIQNAKKGYAIKLNPEDVVVYRKLSTLEMILEEKIKPSEFALANLIPAKRDALTTKLLAIMRHKMLESDNFAITIAEKAFKESIIDNGNVEGLKILQQVINLKKKRPNFRIIIGLENETSYWNSSASKLVLSSDCICNEHLGTFCHELGHALFETNLGGQLPDNWDNIIINAKNISSNNGYLRKVGNELKNIYSVAEKEATSLFEKEISSVFRTSVDGYKKLLTEQFDESLKHLDIDDLKFELKKFGLKSSIIDDIFDQKNDVVSGKNIADVIIRNRMCEITNTVSRTKYRAVCAISDIIDAVFEGKSYDLNGKRINITYKHGQEYYRTRSKNSALHEMMANFTDIKMSGNTQVLSAIKTVFGEEFYNTLDSIYNQMLY